MFAEQCLPPARGTRFTTSDPLSFIASQQTLGSDRHLISLPFPSHAIVVRQLVFAIAGPIARLSGRIPKLFLVSALMLATGLNPCRAAAETIEHTLAEAYLFSPALKSARSTLDAVNEQRPHALSSWLPTIGVTGAATKSQTTDPTATDISKPSSNQDYNQLGLTATLSLPITQGGAEFAKLSAANHMIAAARATLLSAEQNLLFNAATAYLDVLTERAILKAQADNIEALQGILAVVKQQVDAGDRTLPEQTLAELRVSDAEATLIDTRSRVDGALVRYEFITGALPEGELQQPAPVSVLPPTLEEILSLALSANPDVVSSAATALAARDTIRQAAATLLPSLALVASNDRQRQYYSGDFKRLSGPFNTTSIGLQLSVPLYQGGAEYAAIRQAKKIAAARQQEGLQARLTVEAQAREAWLQRQYFIAQSKQYQDTLTLADRLVGQYRRQVAGGEITIFEAIEGYSSQLSARVGLLSADRSRMLADYALLLAVGGLTARTLALNVQYFDPVGDYNRTKWRIWGLGTE